MGNKKAASWGDCFKIFMICISDPAYRVSSAEENVLFYIHPEGEDHVNNKRRAKCQERNINKPEPDARGRNAHLFTNGGTHTKRLPFNKRSEF